MKKMTNHIMVNLPKDERDYLSGNGEGVWVLVDDETEKAYDQICAEVSPTRQMP